MPDELRPAEERPNPRDRWAGSLRGFGPIGIVATLIIVLVGPVIEPLGAVLTLVWASWSRTPLRKLGFVRPRSWLVTLVTGIACGALFKLVMKALVMPLLGAAPVNAAYHWLAGNRAALPGILFEVIVGAGFGEETVYRGFLFERFGRLFGESRGARAATVLITAVWFGALHYPGQGLGGAEQALVTGLVFGSIYAATGRLWPLIIAHAAFDVTAVWIIYAGWETRVAHLIFR